MRVFFNQKSWQKQISVFTQQTIKLSIYQIFIKLFVHTFRFPLLSKKFRVFGSFQCRLNPQYWRDSSDLGYVQVVCLAHNEDTHTHIHTGTDKKGGEAVRQLPLWFGNTTAGPPERNPALGSVCARSGRKDFKRKTCRTAPLPAPLLPSSWAPWGTSEGRPSSHHVMNQFCCHLPSLSCLNLLSAYYRHEGRNASKM